MTPRSEPDAPGPLVHLSVVHRRDDVRIRRREIETLARAFAAPIHFLVLDGQGDALESGGQVHVHDLGAPPRSRILRMLAGPLRAFRRIRELRPSLVHIHDPELLPLAMILPWLGCRVIYDAHEDTPRQIMGKYWIPQRIRGTVARLTGAVEFMAAKRVDAIITVSAGIARRFPDDRTMLVRNFPSLDELSNPQSVPYQSRPLRFAYVGGISEVRGIREMVDAMARLQGSKGGPPRLMLGGSFTPASLEAEVCKLPGWEGVDFRGWVDRPEVARILGECRAGLLLFHPIPNHLESGPNKLFEYLSAGLPVIASDFPVWWPVIRDATCGILVDPLDVDAVAGAMQWILDHPGEAEAMGRRGREAVESKWNWEGEGERLVALYRRLVPGLDARPSATASRSTPPN